jgi:hypothetical protein
MQKVTLFFVSAFLVVGLIAFKPVNKEKINWLTLEQMQAAYKKEPRPILIDVYQILE